MMRTAFPLFMLAGVSLLAEGQSTAAPNRSFYGVVTIEHQPAPPGTWVQVLVVRSPKDFTVCGYRQLTGSGKFELFVDSTPQCVNAPRYDFYVNRVYGKSCTNPSRRAFRNPAPSLDLTEAAQVTPQPIHSSETLPVIYFYGTVYEREGPASPNTLIEVQATNYPSCKGGGRTTTTTRSAGTEAFYIVEVRGACPTGKHSYEFRVNGSRTSHPSQTAQVPPYGTAIRVPLSYRPAPPSIARP